MEQDIITITSPRGGYKLCVVNPSFIGVYNDQNVLLASDTMGDTLRYDLTRLVSQDYNSSSVAMIYNSLAFEESLQNNFSQSSHTASSLATYESLDSSVDDTLIGVFGSFAVTLLATTMILARKVKHLKTFLLANQSLSESVLRDGKGKDGSSTNAI